MKYTNLITPEIMSEIDEINKRCHAMHIPAPPVQFVTAEVSDPDGALIEVFKSKSNSWVRNAFNLLSQMFLPCFSNSGGTSFGAGSQSFKEVTGTTIRGANPGLIYSSFSPPSNAMIPGAGEVRWGILVGTSDVAESFDSHALGAKIAHGSAEGQLLYSAHGGPTASYDPATKKWSSATSRTMTNATGAAIVVKEIGWMYVSWNTNNTSEILISRDVLAAPLTVAAGQTLTITYTSEITYPA